MDRNIVLIGLSGTGKTTIGKMLSERLGMKFIDTDKLIEKAVGKSIKYIFDQYGEDYFRVLENKTVRVISRLRGYVIATGGGMVAYSGNIRRLKRNGILINLKSSTGSILKRLSKSALEERPLLDTENPAYAIRKLLEKRRRYYNRAEYVIRVDHKAPEKITREIVMLLSKKLHI